MIINLALLSTNFNLRIYLPSLKEYGEKYMEKKSKYIAMLSISFLFCFISNQVNSPYFLNFFSQNAILLGGAIFAIHAASSAILVSQLAILGKVMDIDFKPTCQEIRKSFFEDFFWMGCVLLMAILYQSPNASSWPYSEIWLPTGLLFSLIMQVAIIYDVSNAILICFYPDN